MRAGRRDATIKSCEVSFRAVASSSCSGLESEAVTQQPQNGSGRGSCPRRAHAGMEQQIIELEISLFMPSWILTCFGSASGRYRSSEPMPWQSSQVL